MTIGANYATVVTDLQTALTDLQTAVTACATAAAAAAQSGVANSSARLAIEQIGAQGQNYLNELQSMIDNLNILQVAAQATGA